jgi:hypothetical protein
MTMSKRPSKTMRGEANRSERHKAKSRATEARYRVASKLAASGQIDKARLEYERLKNDAVDSKLQALVHSDLAVISAADGDADRALSGFRIALKLDPECEPARLNLALLEVDRHIMRREVPDYESSPSPTPKMEDEQQKAPDRDPNPDKEAARAAHSHLSLLDPQQLPKCLLLFITYNRIDYTRLALDAILKLDYPRLEIVVWDNASTDGTREYLRLRLVGAPNVRLELSPRNMGVVDPMNAVWFGKHDAELLAKVDNDTLVPRQLLKRLAECHLRSNHFGALSGFHFRREGESVADPKNIVTVQGTQVFRQRFVGGCAIMVRRDVLQRIGPVPSARPESDGPFIDGGWTWYQQELDGLGYINGYPWPFVHVDHMEDTRSMHCIRTEEHERYKRDLRGMSLDEFTQKLCVWKPH